VDGFKSLELKEFKGIRSCEKALTFSKFNLLIGPNNSGKSSILEALYLFPYPHIDRRPWPLPSQLRMSELLKRLHGRMESYIYRYTGEARIKGAVKDKVVEITLRQGWNFEVKIDGKRVVTYETASEIFGESPEEFRNHVAFIPNSDWFLQALINALSQEINWDRVEKSGAHVKIVRNFISKVVEDKFTELTIKYNRLMLRKELFKGIPAYIDLRDVGDGIERFLCAAIWLEVLKPKVVLWDDLEASAHPSLIEAAIRWLAEHDWQVIASTHSIDVLHELVISEIEDARVIQLRKSSNDVLSYKLLSIEELERLFDSGQDVRKLMSWG